jgi:hypothetical protein
MKVTIDFKIKDGIEIQLFSPIFVRQICLEEQF